MRTGESRLISWLMIAGGSCLLFLGARDWVRSHVGQSEAEREYEPGDELSLPNLIKQ